MDDLKSKTISGLIWRFGERITAQVISFIVSVVLARILLPEEYGIIAIVTIFINIANVFVTSGLGTSLIQKKDSDNLDFSSMFWASIFLSFFLYLIIFMVSPLIAKIYNNDLLIIVLRIMAIKLPIAAFSSIQQAYVSKKMMYKKFFLSTLFGTFVSAIVGIYMAFSGFGVWALVTQYLVNSIVDTVVLFFTIKWRPSFKFSYKRFIELFKFGWKIMAASLIGTIFDQLRGLVIGIKYSTKDLAFNNKGEQIPNLISINLNTTLDSVLFSSISKIQDDRVKVKQTLKTMLKISAFCFSPILFGLAATSNSLITILLTEKWLPCVPFLQIVCIQQLMGLINTVNMQAIKAIGKSDIILKLEFIKKPLYLIILLITMQFGPLAICIGNAVYGIVALFINCKYNKELFNYGLLEELKDIFYYFILSILMYVFVSIVGLIKINIFLVFIIQVIVGVLFYLGISLIFKVEIIDYIKNFLLKRKCGNEIIK